MHKQCKYGEHHWRGKRDGDIVKKKKITKRFVRLFAPMEKSRAH
jgi:hypothetical protein